MSFFWCFKKRNGFTLVELLAVIVILAIVLIIAVPGVLSIINKTKQKAYDMQLDMIEEAGRLYMTEFGKSVTWTDASVGKMTYVSEDELKHTGYLDKKIEDPRNKKEITDFAVKVTRDVNQKTSYEVIFDYYNLTATDSSCFTFDGYTIFGYQDRCPRDVKIPSVINGKRVRSINSSAFRWKYLTSVILPEGLYFIGNNAFMQNSITKLVIPKSVKWIGGLAFNDNLLPEDQAFIYKRNSDGSEDKTTLVSYAGENRNVVVPNTVQTIDGAFVATKLESVVIPDTVIWIAQGSFNQNKLPDDQAFIYQRNNDGSEDKTMLVSYGGANKNPVIPEGVETIGTYAFGEDMIAGVTLPSTLKAIKKSAFNYNALTSISIPTSVTLIEAGVFNYNRLPEDQAFIYKRNRDGSEDRTTLMSYGGLKKDNVVIPSSVVTIETEAMLWSGVTSLTIPASVMRIGDRAFSTNNITTVTIQGKSSQTDFTTFGKDVFPAGTKLVYQP